MSPKETAALRQKLGMTQQEMSAALLLGKGGDRTVRRWESGERAVSGPTIIAMLALLSGWVPPCGYPVNPLDKDLI